MKLLYTILTTLAFFSSSFLAVPHGPDAVEPSTPPPPASPTLDMFGRKRCGGMVWPPRASCNANEVCVNDPYEGGCGMSCDGPGICVLKRPICGGIAGLKCAGKCVPDPTSGCDPRRGGADCSGVCVGPPSKPY